MSWIEKNQKPLLAVGAILGIAWFGGRYFDESESYSAEKVKRRRVDAQTRKTVGRVIADNIEFVFYDIADSAFNPKYNNRPITQKGWMDFIRESCNDEWPMGEDIKYMRWTLKDEGYDTDNWSDAELVQALWPECKRQIIARAKRDAPEIVAWAKEKYGDNYNAETFHAENESYVCLKNGKTYRKKKRMASHRLMGWLDESPPLPAGHGCYNCGSKKCIGLEELPYRTFFWPKKKRSSNRYGAETYAADFIECKDESCDTGHCPTCGNCWDGIEVSCSKCGDDWGEYSKLLDRELYGAETFEADPEYDGMNYHGDLPYDVMKDAYEQARKKGKPVFRDGKRVSPSDRADWEYYELDDETIDSGYITVYYKDPSDPHTLYEIIFDFDTSDVTPHDYGYWNYDNFNFDPVNPRGYANYVIGHGEDEGKILSSHRFTNMGAETFEAMSFKQWSDDEMHEPKHGGSQMQFDDWLEEEIDSHGDIPLSKWGYEEEHDEKEHQHSESFNAEYPQYRNYKGIFIEKTAKNRAELSSDMWDMTATLYKPRKKGNWILQLTQSHPRLGDRYKTEVKNFTDGLNLYLKLSDLSPLRAETFEAQSKLPKLTPKQMDFLRYSSWAMAYNAYARGTGHGSWLPMDWKEDYTICRGVTGDGWGNENIARRMLQSLLEKKVVAATETSFVDYDGRIRKSYAEQVNENPALVKNISSVCLVLTPIGLEIIKRDFARQVKGVVGWKIQLALGNGETAYLDNVPTDIAQSLDAHIGGVKWDSQKEKFEAEYAEEMACETCGCKKKAETFEAKGDCKECYGTGGLYDSHMGINDECHFCGGTGFEY